MHEVLQTPSRSGERKFLLEAPSFARGRHGVRDTPHAVAGPMRDTKRDGLAMSEAIAPLIAQWESASRWYCVELAPDLFGCWVLKRSWGGRRSNHRGSMQELVIDASGARSRIVAIDRRRGRAGAGYVRVV